MNEQPQVKLTKYQFTILGNTIAYCVLNGIDPRIQPFNCDGRIAAGMFKKGLVEIDPNRSKNSSPSWLITEAGIDAYWSQNRLQLKGS